MNSIYFIVRAYKNDELVYPTATLYWTLSGSSSSVYQTLNNVTVSIVSSNGNTAPNLVLQMNDDDDGSNSNSKVIIGKCS